MSSIKDVEDLCQGLDMGDVLNFYVHHLNADGKACFSAINDIKGQLWTLFVKYDITVEELIASVKEIGHKLPPIAQHCPKIGIEY